ncbi:MAG: AraD1 family protein [Balneolaceae bacterium]
MRLLQLSHKDYGRRVAKADNSDLILIDSEYTSSYTLFEKIIKQETSPELFVSKRLTDSVLNYDDIYQGKTSWKILPAFDHPESPLACLLSGTGLTHKASAENREKMHQELEEGELTDSMKMYLWGQEGGKPEPGAAGVQPEWFYKGNGTSLKAHGEPLEVPSYADDGGEEPEIAGIYLISEDGIPFRIGFSMANEFSDHVMEKKNYLYLAPSKLRNCSIGPELVLNPDFRDIDGHVSIHRQGEVIWSKNIKTGESNMCHSLKNLEYHHFKYDQHRIPGTVHIHFFGADAFSFGEGILLLDGDRMSIGFDGFGRPLVNPVRIHQKKEKPVTVRSFDNR